MTCERGLKFANLSLFLLALTACSKDVQTLRFVDTGRVCIASDRADCSFLPAPECFLTPTPEELLDQQETFVHVRIEDCASQCSEIKEAKCSVTVDEREITITAQAEVEEETGICTGACRGVHASCSLGKLEAGTYNVHYGEASLALDVPGNFTCDASGVGGGGGSAP